MRVARLLVAMLVVGNLAAVSLAQTQPATVTIVLEQGKIVVAPFQQIGGDASHAFVGPAIQQTLIAELGRANYRAVAANQDVANDPVKYARDLGAQYIVTGSYQVNGGDVRITGQLVDAKSGDPLGTLKQTGSLRDLFEIEDVIAEQAKRILRPGATANSNANGATAPAASPPAAMPIQPSGPVQVAPPQRAFIGSDLQQAMNNSVDYNNYIYNPPAPYYSYPYYSYPTYGYGYGYGYSNCYYPRSCYSSYYSCYSRPVIVGARVVSPGTSGFNFSHGYGNVAGQIQPGSGNVAGTISRPVMRNSRL